MENMERDYFGLLKERERKTNDVLEEFAIDLRELKAGKKIR